MSESNGLTPEVAAEYQRLVALGSPPGGQTFDQARANLTAKAPDAEGDKVTLRDIISLYRSGLLSKDQAQKILGIEPTPEPEPRLEWRPDPFSVFRAAREGWRGSVESRERQKRRRERARRSRR